MGEDRAFRPAGCAGGEQDVRDGVAGYTRFAFAKGCLVHVIAKAQEGFPRQLDLPELRRIAAQDDDVTQPRQVLAAQHGRILLAVTLADADETRDRGAAQDVRHFGGAQARVERHDRGTRTLRADRRGHPFPHVGRPDGDTLAGLHGVADQGSGEAIGLGVQGGKAGRWLDRRSQGRLAAPFAGSFAQQSGDRLDHPAVRQACINPPSTAARRSADRTSGGARRRECQCTAYRGAYVCVARPAPRHSPSPNPVRRRTRAGRSARRSGPRRLPG